MKKGLIKAATLIIIFAASLVVFGSFMNQNQTDLTTEMAQAKMPVIVLYYDNEQMNELYGYQSQMKATGMRDTITPVSSNEEIPLLVRTYGCKIDGISYEIRSIDGVRLISDGDIVSFEEKDEQIQTSIPVQSLLEQTREYILTLLLKVGDEVYYYYTRIADAQDCYVSECIRFARQINELTFSKNSDALSTYWEPNVSGDNSSLHKVTINSSLSQANWADFACSKLTEPIPSLKEMSFSYNVVVLNYVVTSDNSDGELEYYNIEEYYRIRYTDERIYLLNFERTMNQIFNGENDFLYDNYLQLGIRSKDVAYMQNETGNITCFVQEGDLFSYNQSSNRLAKVFSFRGHEGIEFRENNMQHDIRILDVDEAGNIEYVVYGYMNRGNHEGETGISFAHYDSLTNTNEEKLFLSFDKSYQVLKAQLDKLLYENAGGGIYLLLNGTVYHIDLQSLEMDEVTKNLQDSSYAASESNRYIAWISDNDSREITVMDLESAKTQTISVKEGKSLQVLGFLQEDLVYGIASDKNKAAQTNSIDQQPMYALRIVNAATAEVLKEYRKKGYYIEGLEFSNGVLTIQRLVEGETGYEKAQQDSIVNRNKEDEKEIIHTTVTEVKQTQVQLTLIEKEKETTPIFIAAKLIQNENQEERILSFKTSEEQPAYYTYARGKAQMVTTEIGKAIDNAYENMGVVVDEQQNYIWKRGRENAKLPMEVTPSDADVTGSGIAKCISAILKRENIEVCVSELLGKGDTPREVLESLLVDREIILIEGGTLSQMLYYVSSDTPVLARKNDQQAVLIVGYDALNVWIYDPQAGESVKQALEDAEELFEKAGGIFLAYY